MLGTRRAKLLNPAMAKRLLLDHQRNKKKVTQAEQRERSKKRKDARDEMHRTLDQAIDDLLNKGIGLDEVDLTQINDK